jgi:SAM-dependent methyltransferase
MGEGAAFEPNELAGEIGRTVAYYDQTAALYDEQVDGVPTNRAAREAFRDHVSMLAERGGLVLDFGCGTGIDATWYAARGHRVMAYDISSGMMELLRRRCAREIAEGRIIPVTGNDEGLASALERVQPVSVIAANFAVLNHVRDLAPLLRLLSSSLRPGGSLVASLLNPWYGGDMRQRWWWRGLLRSLRTGAITMHGDVTTHRHFPRTVQRAAWPHLDLVELARGDEAGWHTRGRLQPFGTLSDPFIFMVLRRSA